MEVNLASVISVLREHCGQDSYLAGFIKEVKSGPVETACINKERVMVYDPEFVNKNVKSRDDLFCMIIHELMHPLFNHFMYEHDMVTGIACDAIINSTINTLWFGDNYTWHRNSGKLLFNKLYKNKGVECLLQSKCPAPGSSFYDLHSYLYSHWRNTSPMTTGELITTLKILAKVIKVKNIMLLGSHGDGKNGKEGKAPAFSGEILNKLARAFRSQAAGHSDNLNEAFKEVLKTHLSIKKNLLRKFTIMSKVSNFLNKSKVYRRITSPIPVYPSKRDMVMAGSDIDLMYWHNALHKPGSKSCGRVCIYLDVSGSVDMFIPELLGIISNMSRDIEKVYTFSNKVYETDVGTISKGKFETTWGTDFDCIAESIKENEHKKCIIMTDGYADMIEENRKYIKDNEVQLLTIYFGTEDEEFKECCLAELGDSVNLRKALE